MSGKELVWNSKVPLLLKSKAHYYVKGLLQLSVFAKYIYWRKWKTDHARLAFPRRDDIPPPVCFTCWPAATREFTTKGRDNNMTIIAGRLQREDRYFNIHEET